MPRVNVSPGRYGDPDEALAGVDPDARRHVPFARTLVGSLLIGLVALHVLFLLGLLIYLLVR